MAAIRQSFASSGGGCRWGRIWPVFLILLAACTAPEPAAPPATLPDVRDAAPAPPLEGRLTANSNEYPWSAIGRLNTGGRGFCTGILVGPRDVLVRPDCLYNRQRGDWWAPVEIYFRAGYQSDSQVAGALAAAIRPAPGYDPQGGQSLANLTRNWALVRLSAPIGQQTGWLGLTWEARDGAAPLLAGYRRDWPHALNVHYGCDAGACPPLAGEEVLPRLALAKSGAQIAAGRFFADGQALAGAGLEESTGRPPDGSRARTAPEATIAQLLWQLGYLEKSPSDSSTADLAAAIRAFEAAQGLPVTGHPTPALLGPLFTAARNAASPLPTS